jgi:hypothetical protein
MLIATTRVHVASSMDNKQIPILASILCIDRFKAEAVAVEVLEDEEVVVIALDTESRYVIE